MATIPAVLEFTDGVRELTDDLDHLEAADALGALLSGEATPEDTAKIITMIYEVSLKKKKESAYTNEHEKTFYFWDHHLCNAISRFGSDELQERRLLQLLDEISKQPNVTASNGCVKEYSARVYWHDLPGLSGHLIDTLDYNHPAVYSHSDGSDFLAQGPHLLSATRFVAGVLKRGHCTTELLKKAFIVLWQALEQNYDETFGEAIMRLERQILLPAAATWILVAGKIIYSKCLEGEIGQRRKKSEGSAWSKQQWEEWKTLFQKFAASEDMGEECRDFASRAAAEMTEIEAGPQD